MSTLEPTSYTYYKNVICQDIIYTRNFKNVMQLPEIVQCVLNSSSNDAIRDVKRNLPRQMGVQLISCQMGKSTRSRKSIASFQLRKGNLLGCTAHLRGTRIYSFLDQCIFLLSPGEIVVEKKLSTDALQRKRKQAAHYIFGKESFTLFPGVEAHFLALSGVSGFNCTLSATPCDGGGLKWLLSALQFPVQPQ